MLLSNLKQDVFMTVIDHIAFLKSNIEKELEEGKTGDRSIK